MSSAKKAILAGVRRSLRRSGPLEPAIRNALDARLKATEPHVQPAYDDDLLERFKTKLESAGAQVTSAADLADVPDIVIEHIKRHNLPMRIVAAEDVAQIEWPAVLDVETRAAKGDDLVAVTGAFAAVAEAGTLALLSGPASPTTLNFLPDDHLVVIRREQLVRHLEDVWAQLRESADMPRVVNLISGPSKTADVEQTLQLGAHGPRRLHVIVVDE